MRGCVSCSKNLRSASLAGGEHDFGDLAAADLAGGSRTPSPQRLRSCGDDRLARAARHARRSASSTTAPRSRRQLATSAFAAGDAADKAEDEHGDQGSGSKLQVQVHHDDWNLTHCLVAGGPVGADVDIDFQRHGEVRGCGHFFDDEGFEPLALFGRKFEHQLVVNLQQQLRLQAVRWPGGGGR